jgi:hypothetical protein
MCMGFHFIPSSQNYAVNTEGGNKVSIRHSLKRNSTTKHLLVRPQ